MWVRHNKIGTIITITSTFTTYVCFSALVILAAETTEWLYKSTDFLFPSVGEDTAETSYPRSSPSVSSPSNPSTTWRSRFLPKRSYGLFLCNRHCKLVFQVVRRILFVQPTTLVVTTTVAERKRHFFQRFRVAREKIGWPSRYTAAMSASECV